jgi:hypothetical protein
MSLLGFEVTHANLTFLAFFSFPNLYFDKLSKDFIKHFLKSINIFKEPL